MTNMVWSLLQQMRNRSGGAEVEEGVALNRCQILPPVRVGFRTYANDSFIRNTEIGRFCSIGRRVSIGAAKHRLDLLSTHPKVSGPGDAPKTTIGNDVWIGDNAIVIAGVLIGDGAVIGAASVVTHDVEPYSIVAGTPARELRKRFEPGLIARLLKSRWWDYGDAALDPDPEEAIRKAQSAAELPPHFRRN